MPLRPDAQPASEGPVDVLVRWRVRLNGTLCRGLCGGPPEGGTPTRDLTTDRRSVATTELEIPRKRSEDLLSGFRGSGGDRGALVGKGADCDVGLLALVEF